MKRPNIHPNNAVAGDVDLNNCLKADLVNAISLNQIEELIFIAESLNNPAHLDLNNKPCSLKEAQQSANAAYWKNVYKEEIRSLKEMGVWELVLRMDIPTRQKIRKGRPIFKIKHNELGQAVRFKVRLVFKGYEQVYGQDYTKTTSPTMYMELWRIFLHLAAANSWDATQINVKTAFLYGLLLNDKVQYMEQPEGFEEPGKENWVCCLVRGLYSMKQARHIWNQMLNDTMVP